MAMLRITTSKVVPYAARAISSGRILTNAFNGCDQVSSPICHHHFSTDAKKQSDRTLAKFLKSEIKSKKMFLERKMPAIPSDFPFTIKDDPTNGGDVNLTRNFHGEKIDVVVEKPFYMDVDDVDSDDDSDVSSDSDDDSNTTDDNDDSDVSSDEEERKVEVEKKNESEPLELKVTISKQNGKISEFKVSASADEIKVNSVLIKEPAPKEPAPESTESSDLESSDPESDSESSEPKSTESSDPLLCFGPHPVEEEGDLQITLREYLKIRGIEKSYYGFLHKYMRAKYMKHPVVALKMLRNFIKE